MTSQVNAACLEERQKLADGQQRLAQVARRPYQLGQRAQPQALRVQAGVGHEMDPQPVAEVGSLSEPEPGLAKRLAHGPLTFGRGPVEGAEDDRRQHCPAEHAVLAEAAAGPGGAPGDLVDGEGADRGQRLGPDVAEDQHCGFAGARCQEGRRLREAVVLHAQHDQVEVVVGLQRLSVAHRPFLDDALPPDPSPRVEQIEVNARYHMTAKPLRADAQRNRETLVVKLARTLATLTSTRSDTLAEASRALEQAVTDLVATAAKDGAVRDDVGAGAVMMALHGIGAAYDRPDWRAEADGVITLVLDGLRRSHSGTSSSA
ncbi:hypothetical protein ACI2LC_11820 [Nonomuraea wenchangensis]|uniref:SbtR family transcriptional regulator n=1 Tax=Nonomuraea wenchangensis TaxID=568860 RepID=UPI0034469605